MRRWVLPLLLMALGAAAIGVLAHLGDDQAERPGVVAPMRGSVHEASQPAASELPQLGAETPRVLEPDAEPAADGTASEPPSAWHGVVVDAADRPLAGASVLRLDTMRNFAYSSHGPRPEDRTLLERAISCEVGADGAFQLPWEVPTEDRAWMLLVRHPHGVSRVVHCAGSLERGGDCGKVRLEPGCRARGRLLAEDGTPAAGADIDANLTPWVQIPADGSDSFTVGLREGLLHANTDADGRFELGALPASSLSLVAQHVGHVPLSVAALPLTPAADTDFGDLRMRRGNVVSGRVVDERGQPVAGAEVRGLLDGLEGLKLYEDGVHVELDRARSGGWDRRGRTEARACVTQSAADGSFEVSGLSSALCALIATADGYEPAALDDLSSSAHGIVLRLAPLGTLRLRLVDAVDGHVLDDADLMMRRVPGDRFNTGDSQDVLPCERGAPGEFIVRGVCRSPLIARVTSPALGLAGLRLAGLAPGTADESREVRVERSGSIAGRVIDSRGGAIPGVRVSFRPYSNENLPVEWPATSVTTTSDGTFESGPLPADDWTIWAADEAYVGTGVRLALAPGQAGALPDIVLVRPALLDVRLIGAGGEPLPKCFVVLEEAGADADSTVSVASGHTDGDGRVQLRARPCAARLTCRDPLFAAEVGILAEGETRALVLQTPQLVHLSGTVLDDAGPVAGARVSFSHKYGYVNATADEHGKWSLDAPGGLPGRLGARSPRGGAVAREIVAPASGSLTIDLQFGTLGLRGRIVSTLTGEPVAGALAQAWREQPRVVGLSVRADAEGRFEIEGLDAGSWIVQAFGEGLTFSAEVAVELPADSARELCLKVDRYASISGLVLSSAGSPVTPRDAIVYLLRSGEDDGRVPSASIELDGSFHFKDVTPGEVELAVTRPPGPHAGFFSGDAAQRLAWLRVPLRLAPGEALRQDLVLPPGRP